MNYITLIKDFEKLRLDAYLPTPNDRWTIGWGHTKDVYKGMKITEKQAEYFLKEDVAWAVDAVDTLVKVPLTNNQRAALISFVFNIGEPKFSRSTLLRKLNAGDFEGAALEFHRWNKQRDRVLKGLVKRRAIEAGVFMEVDNEEHASLVDPAPELKPLVKSKEIVAGTASIFTSLGALLSGINDTAQTFFIGFLILVLFSVGVFIIYNRVSARRKAER